MGVIILQNTQARAVTVTDAQTTHGMPRHSPVTVFIKRLITSFHFRRVHGGDEAFSVALASRRPVHLDGRIKDESKYLLSWSRGGVARSHARAPCVCRRPSHPKVREVLCRPSLLPARIPGFHSPSTSRPVSRPPSPPLFFFHFFYPLTHPFIHFFLPSVLPSHHPPSFFFLFLSSLPPSLPSFIHSSIHSSINYFFLPGPLTYSLTHSFSQHPSHFLKLPPLPLSLLISNVFFALSLNISYILCILYASQVTTLQTVEGSITHKKPNNQRRVATRLGRHSGHAAPECGVVMSRDTRPPRRASSGFLHLRFTRKEAHPILTHSAEQLPLLANEQRSKNPKPHVLRIKPQSKNPKLRRKKPKPHAFPYLPLHPRKAPKD
ncbi:hypothetical protein C7M84_018679 [Penaeus vannamei]|uniref:Uncharacterized protein n=1 Tax=Penaeus vannamei TaxID=6689 RepID=A0A423SGU7_PENVA|nr:hypothetical protein C7M84_018679 [Penaeus vannamei]